MNKTVKTIAWICLVLGLLGLAVDLGAYVFGRSVAVRIQESIKAGEFQTFKKCLGDVDDDGDIDEHDCEERPADRDGWFKSGGLKDGGRGFTTFSKNSGGFHSKLGGHFGRIGLAIPFLLLASGPVLTVIGAVTLIVNRESQDSGNKGKKAKSKKS